MPHLISAMRIPRLQYLCVHRRRLELSWLHLFFPLIVNVSILNKEEVFVGTYLYFFNQRGIAIFLLPNNPGKLLLSPSILGSGGADGKDGNWGRGILSMQWILMVVVV